MATLKELYDALKSDGAPLPETYEKFKNYMTSGPGGGYEHRKKVYDSLKADGAPLPDTYEAFSKSLFRPAAKPSLPSGHNKGQQEHEEQQEQQQAQQVWKPTPMQKAFMMGRIREDADATIGDMRQRVANTRRLAQSQTEEGRNRQKAAEMQARMAGTPTKVLGLSSYTPSSGGGEAGASPSQNPNSPVVHGVRLENGEAKTEWMLPDGSLSTSFIDADKAEYGARKARLQYEFLKRMEENGLDPANSDDVEKQKRKDLLDVSEKRTRIRLAENEENLRELNDRKAERLDADGEWRDDEGFWQNFVRIVGGAAGRSVTANVRRPETSLTQEDRERRTYLAENQVLEEARKQLETRRLNKSDGFMGGFWKLANNWRNMKMAARHTLSDADLYAGGVMALQKATRLTDIEEKLGRGEDLTDAEVSLVYSTMLEQDVRDNTETPHGYNAMQITVEMFPFMAQMLLNPASGLSRAMVTKFGKAGLRKIATRKATQGLAGEAAEAFAKKEMRKLAAKTIGVQVAGDVAEATVLANTLQAPKTAADAIGRYQGNVTEDEKGNLSFDGSHDWGEAVYKAESAAIIENYTEMLGEHFGIIGNAIGKGVGKGLRAIGGGKVVDAVSDMIGKINSSEWVKAISEVEKRAHWNGTVGEVLEEEAAIVLNSIFTGDNNISDLWDADQQIDIVLGVGLFGGFVSGLKTIGYPLSKTKAKSSLRKSDGSGSWRFGDEWGDIRDRIDNAEEKDLGAVIRDLVRTHAKSEEQGKAIVDYAHALMRTRGYEIASASARSEGTVSPEQQDVEDSFEHGEQLAEGSDPQAMNDAKREMERARQKFVNSSSEDFVSGHFDGADAVDNLLNLGPDPELRQQAADYVNAKAVYEGMIQRVRDDVDGRVAQSDAMIESRVNRETGMIQPAVYGPDKKTVYIINGTVAMSDDGSGIDTSGSSESVIIRDAETGKVEFADPRHFVSVEEGIDAEAEKEAARAQIIDEVAVTAANSIDGVLPMTPGDTYTVADDEGNRQEVSVLGETADENGMPVGGSVDIQYPDGTIQPIETSELQERADVAAEGRVEDFAEERDEEREKAAVSDSRPQHGEESGLDNPGRDRNLLPDSWEMPYYGFNTTASRYIESEKGTGGILYRDDNGNDAIVVSALDNDNYVGYFREYDEQGNPTNRWSAKFQNGSGVRENYRDMMQTAQELLPAGHELTEHTSVSTDGLRNLANQLKHGYELQYDEQGNIVTTEVAVNMMAKENALGLDQYTPGSERNIRARLSEEEQAEVGQNLLPFLRALGLNEDNFRWRNNTLYVDHPVLRRADTPQQTEQAAVTENAESVPVQTEDAEIHTENRDLGTEGVPETEIPVDNVQQTDDGGFVETMAAREEEVAKPSALSQVPTDENGEPVYEQVEPDAAWDALVEQTEGDEEIAQSVIEQTIAEKEEELKRVSKQKPKAGLSTSQKIQAEKERKKMMEGIQQSMDHWRRMGSTRQRRQVYEDSARREEARRRAEEARAASERERAEREEAERVEREALNGVPDWSRDTPQDARARGYRRNGPQKVDRQEPLIEGGKPSLRKPSLRSGHDVEVGKEVEVKFSDKELPKGRAAIIDAGLLQPSHIQGSRNPLHFLDEAQPKERDDAASVSSAQKIASNIRPEEITSSATAYTGAPTVNLRGETIQGNSRSDALRLMYESRPEQAARYKQYLIDHAADFGLTPEQISSVENPVLVNMLDVADDEAIRLGQFVAQDTESGGIERIKPKNAVQKMGNRLGSFANILLGSMDDEASLSQLIEANGVETLKWMSRNGFITDTQYGSAFDSKGELSAKAAEDLKGILYHSVFTGGSTRLEEMFNKLPAKAQRAILSTAFRDFDSRREDRMVGELQQSIIAFYDISFYEPFASATNLKDAIDAALAWSRQYAFDDVSGESVLPAEKFSNFALRLAAIYRGCTQKFIQQTFNDLYDAVQGTAQDTLFEEADKTPKSLSEAIRKVLDMEYQPVKRNEDGENRGNAVDVDSPQGEAGRPGGDGDASVGERDEEREESADGRGGAPENSGRRDDVTADTAGESSLRSDHDKDALHDEVRQWLGKKGLEPDETSRSAVMRYFKIGYNRAGKILNAIAEENAATQQEDTSEINEFDPWNALDRVQFAKLPNKERMIDVGWDKANGFPSVLIAHPTEDGVAAEITFDGTKWKVSVVPVEEWDNLSVRAHRIIDKGMQSAKQREYIDKYIPKELQEYFESGQALKDNNKNPDRGAKEKVYKDWGIIFLNADTHYTNHNNAVSTEGYTIEPKPYTNKKGKTLDTHLVTFDRDFSKEEQKKIRSMAKEKKGWQDRETGGYMLRSREDAEEFAASVMAMETTSTADAPVSLSDIESAINISDTENPTAETPSTKVESKHKVGDRLAFGDQEVEVVNIHDNGNLDLRGSIAGIENNLININPDKVRVPGSDESVKYWYDIKLAQFKKLKIKSSQIPGMRKQVEEKVEQAKERIEAGDKSFVAVEQMAQALAMEQVLNDIEMGKVKLNSTQSTPTPSSSTQSTPTTTTEQKPEAKPVKKPSKWVDDEDAEEFERLRNILRNGLGQLNMGFPPELLYAGAKMSYLMMKHGVRKFAEYATAMIEELGDAIRPHLKALYNFTRSTDEVTSSEWANELTPFDEVMSFDTANFDKAEVDAMATAENIVAEQESQQHLEDTVSNIKDTIRQNPDGTTTQTITEGGVEIEVTEGDFIPGVYPPVNDTQNPGKKKPSKSKPSEPKPTTGQLDLFGEEEEQIINDVIEETTPPEAKPEAELSGDSADYQERSRQERYLVDDIVIEIMERTDMKERGDDRGALTMRDIRGMLENYNLLSDISATDLQELVERAMTILTRTAAKTNQADPRKGYDRVVAYYNMQPSLNARDSERLIKQQYSTPTPFGYVMGQFVNAKNDVKSVLEPSAGNGALTIMFDPATVHVNDIDERRLENLRTLGYGTVTAQNGLLPFEGEKVDGVLTNPPFGSVTEKIYDGIFKISSLEGQMAINALDAMKDGGRAAIIIGGNTSYRTNGSMNPKDAAFFGYLYSHYNVADVINISGKALYARNGTGYDVRMILIDGRKTGEFERVYPPVRSKARAEQITTFDELYDRVQYDIQQIQKVGRESADVQREPGTAVDGTTGADVRGGNHFQDKGAGVRPDTTSDVLGSTSGTSIGQPTRGNGGSRSAGMDNGDRGNARSTDNVQRPKSPASGGSRSGGTQNDEGRSGGNRRDTTPSGHNNNGERLAVKPDLTAEKVPYPSQSDNGFTLLSVVPAAQAEVLQRSLGEIGDVDRFLVEELGYSSKEELYNFLAAEQIDSVALAIHQMNKGNAFIIGDMTGVGKGRQGAALIRYAVKQGKCPIYFTQKPTLFTDNYRDLADIGSSELRPFIIASDPKDANIVDANGNVVHKLPSKKEKERVFNYIMQNGKLPKEYDYVLTTYDQIKNGTADYTQNEDGSWNTEARKRSKKSKGYTPADYNGQMRRDALARLAMGISAGKGNIAILDESHTVGGDSGCGRYMQMLTSKAYGVTFLSATFAKRADNMPIYAQRTAISEAGVKANELIEAIAKGGVTLQEIMSKQLVESGQMIRRERSFEGVTIDWLSVEEETNRRQREQFNEVADIFNSIRNFQNDFIKPIIDGMNEAAAERGATVGQTQGTKDMGVRNTPFASKMYNLVNQLLFALKVDAVADRVIENLRNGFKPVISFTNTMEGFLASAPKGVAMDEVPNFSLTLMRALDGVMRFTENDADQNSEGGRITLGQLSADGQVAYNAVKEKIMNLSADLPISPMDAIRMKIEEAGYSVAEITGRETQLNRTEDGRYIVEGRKDRDKKAAMRDFNSGKLDVLMINKSGSTGISLHASSKFEDQRQRVMVFAQFQSDINDEVQMRGRIDRSGQVVRGRYEYIMSTIPAEQRIQMMFKAKLKSLDANTTSSQKSKFNEMEIVDYLNKYGDEVVWEYMREHPELSERLGDPLKMLKEKEEDGSARTSENEDMSKKADCAGKISRHLAFLSVEEQDEIFREITEAYKVKIQLLDDAGENDLEITTMPLRSETKSKQIWHRGENPGSGNAFADNTYVEEVEVDVLKKPMKRAEIEEMTRKLMGDKVATATEYDQMRYGMKEGELNWRRYADRMVEEVNTFFGNKVEEAIDKMKEAGAKRVAKAREKSVKDALKARTKGENTFSDQEIESLADVVAREAQDREEHKQNKRREEINAVRDHIKRLLGRLKAGHIYVVPQDLKQANADMFTQSFGTFVGFKFNKSYTLGSSTAIFATLDGRRKVELALNDKAIETIIRCTETVQRYSPKEINAVSMDNWDSKVPSQTRQKRYIITGNLLQALVDTGKGEKTRGNLISFSTMEGDTRQGILMSENFKPTDLRSSVPLRSRLKQIQDGMTVVSESGDVRIEKITMSWEHRGDYELRVPKSKQKGGQYTMHPGLLKLVDGKNFVTKGNNMVGYVAPENIAKVLDMLSQAPFNLTVLEESKLSEAKEDEGVRFRSGDNEDLLYRIREEEPPTKTGIGYKVFVLKNGMLYPPMVANPNGDATPVGVWLDADAAPVAGTSKTGRMQVKAGGKGTQGGSGKLAYRPGWHLGVIPYALQFNRKGESGEKELFPANFVWAEVEYADDIDYQEEAMSYGYNKNGKFQHSYAGLPRLPINGAYKYRTNPNPETDPWIITGAMKVKRLLTPSEVDEMVIAAGREPQKRQDGAITDEEINDLNAQLAQREREGSGEYRDAEASTDKDPWSMEWGEAMRENRRQRQHEEMERERMREQASALSARLGVEIEIVDDAASLRSAHDGELSARDVERRQRAKGWYDPRTGKITVVVGNHSSASDMEATILHEAVAHHGLRELLGEHFDEFLDKVYDAAENGIKERIDLLATRNGWNRRVATEEYLAGLAEQTDFERAKGGWFDRIKRFFIDMLRKVGFKNITPESIGDNELRYVLWRSYQNLVNPGQHRAFEWEAEDVARQYELGVGDFAPEAVSAPDGNTVLFRDGDFTPRDRVMVADEYERMLSRGRWQFQEAVQDSMLGLKALYESILTEGGKSRRSTFRIEEVAGYENAYLYENRMSSANNGEQHQYFNSVMKPLLESIHELCGSNKLQRRILTDYMMAKHGLERNEYMRNEAASNGEETERDFAGLCGLTGQAGWQKAESVAQQMVDDYEADHDTAELWSNVRKATGETLEKIYLSGLISEDTYNKVLGMYDFYIPLRGWDETTSDEVYGYLTSKDGPLTGSVFKSAEGRESKADDPIATIAMMADDAIRQGNRNIMKQRFLNFVHGHPSDLVSVNELWLQHDDVTGIWEPVFADLQPDMTHAEVENEIAKFEARMEALRSAEPDKYKKGREARNIPYKVVRGNLNEHQVLVKRNGRTYIMTINGNPRAAQALNGLTNPDVEAGGVIGGLLKLGEYVNRNLSAFYTTRNPDFVVSNFLRDMLYSNCMTWVKENPRYALRFHRNFGRVNPMMLRRLLSRWEKDTLSDGNYLERMFKEFMLNGGETGYTSVKDIEGHKRTVAKELRKRGSIGRKAWNALGMQFELLNRSAENCARFAAFLTSREMGRTLDRSIYDAKEVSVNFNKKGSGGKFVDATGQKLLGKIGSHVGGWGRVLFVFWNAGVQGMTNFGRAGKRNPGKALGGAATLFALGCVIPLLAQMIGGGDGDDDDKNAYYNLPEYVRRSNICFKAGDQWITIPLPIEYRAIYGMGELASGVISGNERYGSSELTRQMAAQISQIMPLDMLEGGGGISPFIPSVFKPLTEAYILNRGWTGLPVSKDTPFNKNDPEWTKAYQSVDQHLVAFARWLNETTGGDDYKKGAIDINPAKLEYLLSGTFGGVVSTAGKLKKMGETAFGDREFEWRNMLLANRVIKSGDERTANRKLQNEYFKYKKENEETGRLLKKYENADDAGILGYAERADFLYNSEEYLRYGIFEEYKPDIDEIREELKDTTDPEIKKELQNELYATMRDLVNALHTAGKSSLRSDHDGEGK